jgi:excisionase family DNA binding protein
MEAAQAGEALWTKQEIAERLRISIPTLDREIASGQIVPIRIARQRLVIPESEVQRYLASR